jgi:hypothetical protein
MNSCMPCKVGSVHSPRSESRAQLSTFLQVTATVRWIPLVPAACGTRVARPARTTMLGGPSVSGHLACWQAPSSAATRVSKVVLPSAEAAATKRSTAASATRPPGAVERIADGPVQEGLPAPFIYPRTAAATPLGVPPRQPCRGEPDGPARVRAGEETLLCGHPLVMPQLAHMPTVGRTVMPTP